MVAAASRKPASLAEVRADLSARLQGRRAEIEEATLNRIYAVGDPTGAADSAYLEGLKAALVAALDYGLEGIERDAEPPPPTPIPLLAQARVAARSGVDLGTVLRRYFAGYTLLGHFVVEEAELAGIASAALKELLRTQALRFDSLIAAVTVEFEREAMEVPISRAKRRAELVRGLLAGERFDGSDLAYDFDAHHLGLVATGEGAEAALRELVAGADCRLLLVDAEEDVVWAWLGARRPLRPAAIRLAVSDRVAVSCGEPGSGLSGWRLTHRQAMAASPLARSQPGCLVSYADFALLAGVMQNDLLTTSLRELYLIPLEVEKDRGAILKDTLRAYFAHGRNASSTAAALGVNRNTVSSRLATVEQRIDRSLLECGTDLEVALRLDGLRTEPSS